MRKFFGIVLLVLGVPILLVGAVAAVAVGSDDTFSLTSDQVESDAAAVVTGPSFLEFSGLTLHVTADAGSTETFVGFAHPVHVQAYLDGVAHLELTDVTTQRELTMLARDGEQAPGAPPVGLDWWQDSTSGTGAQTISLPLNDDPTRVVVMNADASAPLDLELTTAAEVDGLFVTTLIVAGIGLVLVVAGVLVLRSVRRRKRARRRRAESPAAPSEDTVVDEPVPSQARSAPRTGFDQLNRAFTLTGIGALALTGCAEVPEPTVRDDDTVVPAATTAQVEGFFTKYTKTNNSANAEHDAEKIGTVEGGTLLATSRYGYQEAQAQGLDPIAPFDITASTTARPGLDQYPMWYLAADAWDGEEEGFTHYLVERQDPTAPWLATVSVSVTGEVETPKPLLRDGLAQVAEESAIAPAQEVFERIVQYAEGGKKPKGVDVANAEGLGGVRDLGIHIADFTDEMGTVGIDCAVDEPDAINWLAAEGGGVMAMASLSCTQTVDLNDGYWFQMNEQYGTIPTDTNLNGTIARASVSFIIGIDADGAATVVDDGAELTATEFTEYTGDTGETN